MLCAEGGQLTIANTNADHFVQVLDKLERIVRSLDLVSSSAVNRCFHEIATIHRLSNTSHTAVISKLVCQFRTTSGKVDQARVLEDLFPSPAKETTV